jgi:hypothetical protein
MKPLHIYIFLFLAVFSFNARADLVPCSYAEATKFAKKDRSARYIPEIYLGSVKYIGVPLSSDPKPKTGLRIRVLQGLSDPWRQGGDPGLIGRDIFLEVKNLDEYHLNDIFVFFTVDQALGADIVLREVMRMPSECAGTVETALRDLPDSLIVDRLETAELVVEGVIISVKAHPFYMPGGSEHDPEWRTGSIQVTQTLKGPGTKNVELVFPGNPDRGFNGRGYPVKKQGIFILHKREFGPNLEGYFADDRSDFQESTELARIRKLLSTIETSKIK